MYPEGESVCVCVKDSDRKGKRGKEKREQREKERRGVKEMEDES